MGTRIIKPAAGHDYYVVNPHEVQPPEFSGTRSELLAYASAKGWGDEIVPKVEELEALGGRFNAVFPTAAD